MKIDVTDIENIFLNKNGKLIIVAKNEQGELVELTANVYTVEKLSFLIDAFQSESLLN